MQSKGWVIARVLVGLGTVALGIGCLVFSAIRLFPVVRFLMGDIGEIAYGCGGILAMAIFFWLAWCVLRNPWRPIVSGPSAQASVSAYAHYTERTGDSEPL